MKLSTIHTPLGTVIRIETDESLDLRAQAVFQRACRLAEHPDLHIIEVNLGKTRDIRGSGVAMLKMLRERTDPDRHLIRLVNCRPEIRQQLVTCSVGKHCLVV
jgi:hypothetical protein